MRPRLTRGSKTHAVGHAGRLVGGGVLVLAKWKNTDVAKKEGRSGRLTGDHTAPPDVPLGCRVVTAAVGQATVEAFVSSGCCCVAPPARGPDRCLVYCASLLSERASKKLTQSGEREPVCVQLTARVFCVPILFYAGPGPPDLPGAIGQVIASGGGKVVDARAALAPSNKEAVSIVCGFFSSNAVRLRPDVMGTRPPQLSGGRAAGTVDPEEELIDPPSASDTSMTERLRSVERRAQLSTVTERTHLYAGFLWR